MYPRRRFALRLTVPLVLVLVLLSAVLIALRIEQVLLDSAQGRSLRAANQLREQIEGGFRLGLSLSDQSNLTEWLQRQRAQDAGMAAAQVLAEDGQPVSQLGVLSAFSALNPVWSQQLLAQGVYARSPASSIARNGAQTSFVGVVATDPSGRRVAVVWLAYDRSALRQSAWSVLHGLLPWVVGVSVALVAGLGLLAAWWIRATHARLDAARQAVDPEAPDSRARGPLDVVRLVDGPVQSRRHVWRELLLVALAFGMTFVALGTLAWKAREIARPLLLAQIDQSARTVLQLAQSHIDRALLLGIPPRELVGVDAMFQSELQPAQEIAFLALQLEGGTLASFTPRDTQDQALAAAARAVAAGSGDARAFRVARQPLQANDQPVGELVTGTALGYVDQRLRSMLIDLIFAVIVSLVLVREVLGALWERSELKPYLQFEAAWQGWRHRAQHLAQGAGGAAAAAWLQWLADVRTGVQQLWADATAKVRGTRLAGLHLELVRIRLIVFLTALSDELLRPFFTVFASEATPLALQVSPTMLAGLPVAGFMLMLALAQPLGPWLTRRVEMRTALFATAVLGAALLGATAWTRDSAVLIALRAGSGLTYGLMLILAQTAIVRMTNTEQRARGLVEVSAAIVAAGVCGPALGGLLVERLGTGPAFAACAASLALAALLAWTLQPLPRHSQGNLAGLGGAKGLLAVLRHPRVMAVTWFAAVPARLAAAALLVVVTPLYVLDIGETPAISGRLQLLYFLAFMIVAPWAARGSDLSGRRKPWVIAGCVLSALACAALPVVGGVVGMALCCALLGVAQAVLSAPQLAMVTEAFGSDRDARGEATPEQALAAFRFVERFGSILAPFAVALAVAQFGLMGAVGAIGVVLALGAAGLVAALFNLQEKR